MDIKVEAERDDKVFKNETEQPAQQPAAMVDENKPMLVDIDKFEPIESDEDEAMCEQSEIKDEIDDSQNNSLELDNLRQESTNKDLRSQADVKMSHILDQIKVNCDDFNIENSKEECDDLTKSPDAIIPKLLPKNEIEDIQQKLHSFHSVNLMILQSRNKKRASRATTPTSLDDVSTSNMTLKESLLSSSSSEHSKNRKVSSEDHEYKREQSAKIRNDDDDSYNQYITTAIVPQNVGVTNPSHSYSSYVLNNTHRIETNQPTPSTQMYQTPQPPSGYPSVNSQLTPNISSSNSLYQYLENPNRAPGYNTGYNAPHMFPLHTNVPPPTLLNSSNYLTKSYSTLSEPTTSVGMPSTVGSTQSSNSSNPVNIPKVLSRTQSADPRLNPQKDLPPATPKRKLSINEYRKRKQLTTVPEKQKVEGSEKTESSSDPTIATQIEDKPKNGISVADATKDTGKFRKI